MQLVVQCQCGWQAEGSEEEIVAAAAKHGREVHNQEPTREQIMTMARPATGFSL